jgi:hypothetical protein
MTPNPPEADGTRMSENILSSAYIEKFKVYK